MRYVVTNVRLEAFMLRAIKERALERGVPASVLIREALQDYLATPEMSKDEYERAKQELLRFCGVGRSKGKGKGKRTGSTDIDEVLYGPRRSRKRKR